MPIYEIKVKGADKPRMIKADSVAAALADIVEVKAISAERMLELQDGGVALEKVEKKPEEPDPADPANYAPGGPLHGKTPPAGTILAEDQAKGGKDKSGGAGDDAGK